MILVVGPTGAGKTLLLKRLEAHSKTQRSAKPGKGENLHVNLKPDKPENSPDEEQRETVPPTISTTGTYICNLTLDRRNDFTLKEIGGSMAAIWKSSCKDAHKVIFVIDLSNPYQISAASILLRKLLSESDLSQTPILLVLNKIDNFSTISHPEMKKLLGLDELNSLESLTMVEASAKYGSGLDKIIKWISEST